jgi:hypothetical protein
MKTKYLLVVVINFFQLFPFFIKSQELDQLWNKANIKFTKAFLSDSSDYTVLESDKEYIVDNKTGNFINTPNNYLFLGFMDNNNILFFSGSTLLRYNILDSSSVACSNNFSDLHYSFSNVNNYCFSFDRSKFYVKKEQDSVIEVYDLNKMIFEKTIKHRTDLGQLSAFTISNDNKYIAYLFFDKQVLEIRDYNTGTLVDSIGTYSFWTNSKIFFSPDNKSFFFYNDSRKQILIYDILTGYNTDYIVGTFNLKNSSFYPDSRRIFAGNTVINLDSLKSYSLGFSANSLKIINGEVFYFCSNAYSAFLRDSTGKILKFYYLNQNYVSFMQNEKKILCSLPLASLLNIYSELERETGNIISLKILEDIGSFGYIKEYNQYYYVESVDSNQNTNIKIYDYVNDNLIEDYTLIGYRYQSFQFLYGKKYALVNGSQYFNWNTKEKIDPLSIPELSKCKTVEYSYIDTNTHVMHSFIYIINQANLDTIKINNDTSNNENYRNYKVINNDHSLISYLIDKSNQTRLIIFNLNNMDTIYKFENDFIMGNLISKSFQIFINRYMIIPFSNNYWVIYDMIKNNGIAKLHSSEKLNILDFSDDLTYAITNNNIGSGNSTLTLYKTNIDATSVSDIFPVIIEEIITYPNPTAQTSNIKFDLVQPSNVSLKLTDILGSQISLINNQFMESGSHSYDWDASGYPAGVYYYVLSFGNVIKTGKVVVVK